ncbi:uncharacterized protein LOC117301503 isoform X2 [Asterias rubens]|uniref:uncharacterized protein LOC117301503 isoform X2 n=1 Tax=Asterias rubens TaxID=7604 RepID=UPI001454E872|nr:uncharacterized protein LOC117301503 isoform X2 [Asterias rubens]
MTKLIRIVASITRNFLLSRSRKVFLVFVLGLVALIPLLIYRDIGNRSVQRNVDQVHIFAKPEDHDTGQAGQSNTTTAMTKTTRPVPELDLGRPPSHLTNVSEMTDLDAMFERMVIVTAVSDNHVKEAMGMIASAQQYMPNTPIYLYDLGLKNETYKKLSIMCNVKIRGFDFNKYPPHVRTVHTYTWKIIIIREALKEFGVIFYGDSSVRFKGNLRTLFPLLRHNHGFMFHIHSFDPKLPKKIKHQYYFTNAKMYSELGVDRVEYFNAKQAAPHISAGRVLIANNSMIWEKVFDPWLECGMKNKCIAPAGSKYGIHRYDASALAIIVYKNLRYMWTEENNNSEEFDTIVEIVRGKSDANVKYCPKNAPH